MCRSPWLPPSEGGAGNRDFGVIRHAERADAPFATVNGLRWTQTEDYVRWPLDPPLSDEGVATAQVIGGKVLDFYSECGARVDVVVTSPYLRCIQTAATICDQLGHNVRMVIDNSLGEIYGPSVMGSTEPSSSVIRPVEEMPEGRLRERVAACKVVGEAPAWPEDARGARRRFASRFLWYLRWACKAKRNFLLVTHADSVAAALRVIPSHAEQSVQDIDYGGRFMVSLRPECFRFSMQQLSPTERMQQLSQGERLQQQSPTSGRKQQSPKDWLQQHSPKDRPGVEGAPRGGTDEHPSCSAVWQVPSPKMWPLEEAEKSARSRRGSQTDLGEASQAPPVWQVRTEGIRLNRTGERRSVALAKRLRALSSADCSPARELLELLGVSPGGPLAPRTFENGLLVSQEPWETGDLAAESEGKDAPSSTAGLPVLTDIRQSFLLRRRKCLGQKVA